MHLFILGYYRFGRSTATSANIVAGLRKAGGVERTGRDGGVTVGVVEGTYCGCNVIARDLLSMSCELPLVCESDYQGI